MAKSDSFFIRASVTTQNNAALDQQNVDLGAYVDALGKSVLRIHNVAVQIVNSATNLPPAAGGQTSTCAWQLTTQSQTALVAAVDKSVISTGALRSVGGGNESLDDAADINPQMWSNGYLVGVEQIYLGAIADANWATAEITFNVVMECTVETLSQSAAMALALSQQ